MVSRGKTRVILAIAVSLVLALSATVTTGVKTATAATYCSIGGVEINPGKDKFGRDLSGLVINNCSLQGASLAGANLAGTTLGEVNLKGIRSGKITGTPAALPFGWSIINGYLVGPGANLQNADLAGVDFGERDLFGVDLSGASLQGANLARANLPLVRAVGISGVPILPSSWKYINKSLVGRSAVLRGADLTRADLAGMDLSGTDFRGSLISGVSFRNSVLNYANFESVDVSEGDFSSSDLGNANFWESNLSDCNLQSSNLQNAIFVRANLARVSSGQIEGLPAELPNGWSLDGGYLLGPSANLAKADLRNLNLSRKNLSSASLNGANLENAQLAGADLSRASLTGVKSGSIGGSPPMLPSGWILGSGHLIGPGADLTDARLLNVSFQFASLRGVNFSKATIENADLSTADLAGANVNQTTFINVDLRYATLIGVKSGQVSGNPLLPANWLMVDGFWLGPGADLRNENLESLNIEGADLQGADLSGVRSGKIAGNATLSSNWTLYNGYLIGPEADLRGQNMAGFSFSGMNLTGVDFSESDLSGADFKSAILREVDSDLPGASFDGAKLSGATFGLNVGVPSSLPTGWIVWEGSVVQEQVLTPTPGVSGDFKVGQTLTSTPGTWDPGVTLTYQWLRDGVGINGATQATLVLTAEDNSKQITVEVAATRTGYATVKKTSTAVKVEAGTQTLAPTPTISGTNKVGQTLNATPGSWDSSVTLAYQWLRDGVAIAEANKNTLQLTTEDNSKQITVEVTATKTGYVTVKKTSTAVKVEAGTQTLAPTPTISGTNKVGQTLNATPGSWDSGVTLAYQWVRDGVKINGAASASYVLTPGDFGRNVCVEVTGALAGYATVSKASAQVKVAAGLMMINTPKVSGTAKSGNTLKVTTSAWVKGSKITYQWLSNGAVIKGATSSSLKISSALKGKKISVKVTQSATGYTTATKTSATVTVSK